MTASTLDTAAVDPASSGRLSLTRVLFRRDSALVIDGVSATIEPGTVTALIGPNGAGKTTLLHLIAKTLTAESGSIEYAGTDLLRMPRRRRAAIVALGEQDAFTDLALTVFDVVMLGRTPYRRGFADSDADHFAVVDTALSRLGMTDFADRLYGTLSGGERQRVNFARALAQQPQLLLLDEPTNHLDIRAQLETLALVRDLSESGITVVAALHDLNHAAAYADQVIVLAEGRVLTAGRTVEVLTPELIRGVYSVTADVVRHPRTGRPLIIYDAPASRGGVPDGADPDAAVPDAALTPAR
ncbi:MAG: ABC transporter ATP-binding protein [Microbacteriaceae bacterium]